VVIIDHGKLVYDGGLEDLINRYAQNKLLTVTFSQDLDHHDLARFGTVLSQDGYSVKLEVPRQETARTASELLRDLPVADISIADVEAEEVIRQIFADGRT
jgi:ABC-2 type transport system ATP-binding protein